MKLWTTSGIEGFEAAVALDGSMKDLPIPQDWCPREAEKQGKSLLFPEAIPANVVKLECCNESASTHVRLNIAGGISVTGSELSKPLEFHFSNVRLAIEEGCRAAFLQMEVGHLVFGPGKMCTVALEEVVLQLSVPKGVISGFSEAMVERMLNCSKHR